MQEIGTFAEPPETTILALDTVTAGRVTANELLLALALPASLVAVTSHVKPWPTSAVCTR